MQRGDKKWAGVSIGLLGAAVAKELRKPASERTWHGQLGGLVYYDFRPPTPTRVRESFWNPESDRLFTPTVFGVGYSVNLARLAREVRSSLPRSSSDSPASGS
jgi:Family of unknown function (DUF5808)